MSDLLKTRDQEILLRNAHRMLRRTQQYRRQALRVFVSDITATVASISEPGNRSMKAKIEIELQPFQVPNFVLAVPGTRSREDGFTEAAKFALSELSALTLEDLCDQFRAEVFKKAGKRDPDLDRPKVA